MNDADVNTGATSTPTTDVNGTNASTVQTPSAETPQVSSDVKQQSDTSTDNATPKVESKTPLDVVRSALQPTEDKKPDASASGTEQATPKAEEKELPALTPEEEAKLPFHKHPRWKEVLGQRDQARAKVAEYEEPARQFGLVQKFISENNLTPPEVADGFTVMALMRNNPAQALPIMRQYVEQLELITGNRLPADLAEQVDRGAITEDAAKEMATLRLNAATTKAQNEKLTSRNEEQTRQTVQTLSRDSVNEWQRQTAAVDPDFGRKEPFIRLAIQAALGGRQVKDAAEALQVTQQAYQTVTEQFKKAMPANTPRITPPTPRGGDTTGSGGSAPSAPKTALEATKRALGHS